MKHMGIYKLNALQNCWLCRYPPKSWCRNWIFPGQVLNISFKSQCNKSFVPFEYNPCKLYLWAYFICWRTTLVDEHIAADILIRNIIFINSFDYTGRIQMRMLNKCLEKCYDLMSINRKMALKFYTISTLIQSYSCFSFFGFEIRWIHLISWIR